MEELLLLLRLLLLLLFCGTPLPSPLSSLFYSSLLFVVVCCPY